MKFLIGGSIRVQGRLTLNFAPCWVFFIDFLLFRPGPSSQTQKNAADFSVIWMEAKVLIENMNL